MTEIKSSLTSEQPTEAWYELVPNEKSYTMLYRESHIISTSAFIGPETTHTNVHNPHEPQRIHLKLHYTYTQGKEGERGERRKKMKKEENVKTKRENGEQFN